MTERTPVSVCMATYNGARHVADQVNSILSQLSDEDELVIVDDCSRDSTLEVVSAIPDPRIRVTAQAVNRGYVRTFEHALLLARHPHVLLSDQDDVWLPGRVEAMSEALSRGAVVATNLTTLGGAARLRGPYGQADWKLRAADSSRHARNVLGILAGNRPYYGCAMGVRRSDLDRVLPFPDYLDESHDLWLALYGNVAGSMVHLEIRSLARRLHDTNQTPVRPRGPLAVLRSRLMLIRSLITLRRRLGSPTEIRSTAP